MRYWFLYTFGWRKEATLPFPGVSNESLSAPKFRINFCLPCFFPMIWIYHPIQCRFREVGIPDPKSMILVVTIASWVEGVDVTHPPLLVVYICHRPSSLEWLHCLAWRVHLQLKASGWESPFDLSAFWTKTRGQTRFPVVNLVQGIETYAKYLYSRWEFQPGPAFFDLLDGCFFLKTSEVADRWEGVFCTKWSCWYFF